MAVFNTMAVAIWLRGLFLLLLSTSLFAADESPANSDGAVQKITTPGGHAFWYYSMPEADRTALAISWAQEVPLTDANHPSTAYIGVDVMLKGGAGGHDAAKILADFEDLDSGSGVWVQPRSVSGFFVAPNSNFSKAREIASRVLSDPAFEQRWFEREKQNLIERAIDFQKESWGKAWILTREIVMRDHPYRKAWDKTPLDSVKAVTLADVKQWHESSFSTKTSVISVAGSSTADAVAKEIDLLFAELPDTPLSEPIEFKQPEVPGKTILLHSPEAPKSVLILMGNLPPHHEANNTSLRLAVGVLGHGQHSRLFKSVRAGLGATYGFYAGVESYTREHRMLEMSGEVETEKLQAALDEIETTYTKFLQSGIGRIEFPIAKRFFSQESKKGLSNPVNVAFSVIDATKNGFSTDYVHNVLARIDSLTRDDVNRVIVDSFPSYDNLLKVIISPDENAVADACVISEIEDAKNCF